MLFFALFHAPLWCYNVVLYPNEHPDPQLSSSSSFFFLLLLLLLLHIIHARQQAQSVEPEDSREFDARVVIPFFNHTCSTDFFYRLYGCFFDFLVCSFLNLFKFFLFRLDRVRKKKFIKKILETFLTRQEDNLVVKGERVDKKIWKSVRVHRKS